MHINRRKYLLWGSALAASSSLGACATATSHSAGTSGTGFHRQRLGNFTITAVSDGSSRRPLDASFVRNASLTEVQAALAAQKLPTEFIDVPYTCYVIETAGKRYLLDTGFGDNGGPGTGLLHTHLQAAGIAPDSIEHIILSHLHGDHINGLRHKNGQLAFPKATVYIAQPEMAFWGDDARMQAAPPAARTGFQNVRRVFTDYPRGQIKLFVPGSKINGVVDTLPAFGHTPGHSAIAVGSGKERFTFVGDTSNYPPLFARQPHWQVMFDMNPEQATHTRKTLFKQLAQEGGWVGGFHFPLPGFGHLHTLGNGFDWVI
jgi:glyoxylase-like metal-dependent hydrolase (beta-lactamase superfamily II)